MTNPDNVGGLRYTDYNVMNGLLCDFSTRWKMDGDYIRCRTCKRPQLTSYGDNDFPHAIDCRERNSPTMERRPWQTYVELLAPLCLAAPAGGDAEVVRLRQLLAGTQEQFRVVSELLERNQAHHERMMKLMDSAPAGGDRDPLPTHHCQNGRSDICLAANYDGVCCPDDSCDIDDGVRDPRPDSAPAGSGEALELADRLDRDWDSGRVDWDNVKDAAALLRKLQQGADEGRSRAYDQVDRFLRNNLGDEAYAEYSEALEVACGYAASQGQEGGNDA